MGGSSKSSSQKSQNIYGSIMAEFGWGPYDWTWGFVYNGNWLVKYDTPLTLTTDVTDLTGALLDPAQLAVGGYFKFYRGTLTQPADPISPHGCRFLGTGVVAAHRLFFGQDSGSAGNLQGILGRIPRVDTSIVAALDNVADDYNVNPVAFVAEFILDERGCNRPLSFLHAPSWLAAAHWCAQDQAHKDFSFCSSLVTALLPLRDLVKQLLEPLGIYLRWVDNQLGCFVYEWGVDPGGLPIVDASAIVDRPAKFEHLGWRSIPTKVTASYPDRDYEWQTNYVTRPNARALLIRQIDDPANVERPHVVRRVQAAQHVDEYIRRLNARPGTGPVVVRAPLFSDLSPGDKVRANVNLKTSGDEILELCRVEKIEQDATDAMTLTLMLDSLAPAVPYTPAWASPPPVPDAACAPLVHALAIPLPYALAWPPSVGFVAARPDATLKGFNVYFDTSLMGAFHQLGDQSGFAVRATLTADIASGDATADLNQTDGVGGPDANLAADTPGGNLTQAEDDTLLVIFCALDGGGLIAVDGNGQPIMELASIVDRTPVAGATFTYDLLRGRLGTTAAAWTAAGTAVWIVPRSSLVAWRHQLFDGALGTLVYFRLEAFNAEATAVGTPPDFDLNFPLPPPLANIVAHAPASAYPMPPQYDGTTQLYGCVVTFDPPVAPSYAGAQWALSAPITGDLTPTGDGTPIGPNDLSFYYYNLPVAYVIHLWTRTKWPNGVWGPWINSGINLTAFATLVAP